MAAPNPKPSDLMNAVRAGNLDGVLLAIAQGADVEEADMHGHPGLPLRTASFSGHFDIVLALLEHGADVNAPTADGNGAPLRLARRGKHQAIASLLLERGAEIPYDGEKLTQAASPTPAAPPTLSEPAAAAVLAPSTSEAVEPAPSRIPGDLRRHPRPESNLIEFTTIAVPAAPERQAPREDHGNSIEFTLEVSTPSPAMQTPPSTDDASATTDAGPLPDFSEPPPYLGNAHTAPEAGEIEEIEMSVPYGVDTEILASELTRIEEAAAKQKS